MDFQLSEKMEAALGLIDEFVNAELVPMETAFLTKDFIATRPPLQNVKFLYERQVTKNNLILKTFRLKLAHFSS